MNRVLCVTEYQSIRKAEVFCAAARTVTVAQFQQLERFNEQTERQRRIKAFQHGARNTLIAQNFVGVIHLNGWQVEVLPKIEAPQHRIRQNLLQMVACALNLQLHGGELASLDRASHSVLDVLIRLYCDLLWQAIHKGVVRRYQNQQDNLATLRGRLNITQQLRHNLARPDRLHCTFDEFTPDNLLNRALKAALRVLHRLANTETASKSIAELLFCFDGVSDMPASAIQWEQATTDRLSERYAPLIRMARLFVEGGTPDLTSGRGDGFAVLFDMNQLFEMYVGRRVQRVCAKLGLITQLQGPRRHLAQRRGGTPCFELRPDIVISESGKHLAVIDTKWKRIKVNGGREEISTSDLYQMFAYAKQYQAPCVMLLYPHHTELGEWRPCLNIYQFREPEKKDCDHALKVASLPLVDLKLADEYLTSMLNLIVQAAPQQTDFADAHMN